MTNIQRQGPQGWSGAWDQRAWREVEPAPQIKRSTSPGSRRETRVFPSIIISAATDRLIVRAEVPGMNLDQLEISVSGGILTIQGIRQTGEDLVGGWYHRRERESGGFSRAVQLPADVDGEQAEASYEAGVLTVTLPLREAVRPKQVPIRVAQG